MRSRSPQSAMMFSFFIIALSFWNFSRITNSGGVRAIHVVTLLVCGMGIGIFLSNLFMLLRNKS